VPSDNDIRRFVPVLIFGQSFLHPNLFFARRVTHAGTTTLRVTSLHAKATAIMAALNAVTKRLKELALTATTQLAGSTTGNRWDTIISAVFDLLVNSKAGPHAVL